MTTADALGPPANPGTVQFLGREPVYWRLRIKGAGLLMLTLGIYRFWFATDVRRYLWSNTEIGGETLEYTGLATELLGGFLLAVAIVVPLYTGVASAALALNAAAKLLAAAGFMLLVLLGQFALYRARRYRLTRTVFRGVRFDQHGSAWRYAFYALCWWALAIVTLGLAYPWLAAALQRFKLRRTSYGDLEGSFAGSGTALALRLLPLWLAVAAPIAIGVFALGRMVDWNALNAEMAHSAGNPFALLAANAGINAFFVGAAAIGVSIVAVVALYPLFAATLLRWWISGLRFGTVTVQSHLPTAQVYRLYARFVLYVVPFVIAVAVVGGISVAVSSLLIGSRHDSVLTEFFASAVSLVIYVVVMLGASTIYQVVVTFALWRLGAQSAALSGADAFERVRAAGAPDTALGEGLVDALGVGGI